VTCEIINWKTSECDFASKESFASSNPKVNFGQRQGSFPLPIANEHDFGYFGHRVAECLDLPKPVNCKILAFQPAMHKIRQLRAGDYHSWRKWVLDGCPGEPPRNTKFGHLYVAVDFADCLRLPFKLNSCFHTNATGCAIKGSRRDGIENIVLSMRIMMMTKHSK